MGYRRVNLFSGPGVGKSTAAAHVFASLKRQGVSCDLVQEKIKEWAYSGQKIGPYDQLYIFAEQLRREELLLRNDVKFVITDSPVKLGICYGVKYECPFCQQLSGIIDKFDQQYPPLNILLKRGDAPYNTEGRYETYEQALEMDKAITDMLNFDRNGYTAIDAYDIDGILNVIRTKLEIDV